MAGGSSRPTSPAADASTQASTATPATTSARPPASRPTRARVGGWGWVGSRIRPAYPVAPDCAAGPRPPLSTLSMLLSGRLPSGQPEATRPGGRGMKLAIGAVLTFFAVALAGQRAERITRLIASGQPAPDR